MRKFMVVSISLLFPGVLLMLGGTAQAAPAGPPRIAVMALASGPPVMYYQHSFWPAAGSPGAAVTISGYGFTGTTAVTFTGSSAPFTVTSDKSITTKVPAGAKTGPITVTTAVGTATTTESFTVNPTPPTYTRFTPTSGPVGTKVTVSGGGFAAVTGVSFNNVPATAFTVTTSGSLTATVPPDATTGPITITTATGGSTTKSSFTLTSVGGTPTSPQSLSITTTGVANNSATLRWTAPVGTGSSAITKYHVSRDGVSSTGFGAYATDVSAGTLSLTFNQLLPGVSYRFTVRAINPAGSGAPAGLTYKTKRYSSVFAVDTVNSRVVQIDANGGGVRAIGLGFTAPTQVLRVPAGKVVVLDRGTKKVVRVDPASGLQTILAPGKLTNPQQISVDAQGNVFTLDQPTATTSQIVRIDAVSNQATVAVPNYQSLGAVGWIASSVGKVFVIVGGFPAVITRYSGFPASPVATIIRDSPYPLSVPLTTDPAGGVYFRSSAGGGSGAYFVSKVAAGSNTEQVLSSIDISTLTDGLVTFDPSGNLFSAYPRFFCFTPASVDGCVDDPGVDVINRQLPSGAVKQIPVAGFTLSNIDSSPPQSVQAFGVDAQGVIVVQRVGGIAAYAPNGGTPDPLATGTFTSLAVG